MTVYSHTPVKLAKIGKCEVIGRKPNCLTQIGITRTARRLRWWRIYPERVGEDDCNCFLIRETRVKNSVECWLNKEVLASEGAIPV